MAKQKPIEMQECSKAVYDILVAFNNLSSLAEQEEVLDVIYDALYCKMIREVLDARVAREFEIERANHEKERNELRAEINKMKVANEELRSLQTRKGLRHSKQQLLIIINNLKHYLGDSWQSIFPYGSQDVDAYLEQVDVQGILHQDTWSQLTEACKEHEDCQEDFDDEELSGQQDVLF